MYVFTIFIPQKNTKPDKYLAGTEAIRKVYPELVVIDSWGNCPVRQSWNIRQAVECLKVWTLAQHKSALCFDPDVSFGKGQILFDCEKPIVAQVNGSPESWAMGHDGHPEYFSNGLIWKYENQMNGWWLIDYLQSTIDQINLIPSDLIRHEGFTQNNITGTR
jgi:hypothetical protein